MAPKLAKVGGGTVGARVTDFSDSSGLDSSASLSVTKDKNICLLFFGDNEDFNFYPIFDPIFKR